MHGHDTGAISVGSTATFMQDARHQPHTYGEDRPRGMNHTCFQRIRRVRQSAGIVANMSRMENKVPVGLEREKRVSQRLRGRSWISHFKSTMRARSLRQGHMARSAATMVAYLMRGPWWRKSGDIRSFPCVLGRYHWHSRLNMCTLSES